MFKIGFVNSTMPLNFKYFEDIKLDSFLEGTVNGCMFARSERRQKKNWLMNSIMFQHYKYFGYIKLESALKRAVI